MTETSYTFRNRAQLSRQQDKSLASLQDKGILLSLVMLLPPDGDRSNTTVSLLCPTIPVEEAALVLRQWLDDLDREIAKPGRKS